MDLNLLKSLMTAQEQSAMTYVLHLNNKQYPIENVSVTYAPTPVNSPTTRGGVYFSDKFAYKVKGTVKDLSVVPLLSKTMLGPNTDFGEIKITTSLALNGKNQNISLFTNLTNSVQTSSQVELSMILINIEFT